MKVIHFKSQEERFAFLKGEFEEIVPQKAEKPKNAKKDAEVEKKFHKKASKAKKKEK